MRQAPLYRRPRVPSNKVRLKAQSLHSTGWMSRLYYGMFLDLLFKCSKHKHFVNLSRTGGESVHRGHPSTRLGSFYKTSAKEHRNMA